MDTELSGFHQLLWAVMKFSRDNNSPTNATEGVDVQAEAMRRSILIHCNSVLRESD